MYYWRTFHEVSKPDEPDLLHQTWLGSLDFVSMKEAQLLWQHMPFWTRLLRLMLKLSWVWWIVTASWVIWYLKWTDCLNMYSVGRLLPGSFYAFITTQGISLSSCLVKFNKQSLLYRVKRLPFFLLFLVDIFAVSDLCSWFSGQLGYYVVVWPSICTVSLEFA